MQSEARQLIQKLHQAPEQIVYVAAGAGTKALNALLGVAGASRTLLEGVIPYSEASFEQFLGSKPQTYVSKEVAHLLAGRALTRAQLLADTNAPLVGVACTATIVTDRLKRGTHRAHIAVWRKEKLKSYYLLLDKGKRNRKEEERVVSSLILNAIAETMGVEDRVSMELLSGDKTETTEYDYKNAVKDLYNRQTSFFGICAFGRILNQDSSPQIILSGSFNPLHQGHLALVTAATKFLNKPVSFELSATNVDKPPLEKTDTLYRISQFAGQYDIYLTNAPTFLEKARLFGETTFVVGFDTAVRILMPKYYGAEEGKMWEGLQEFRDRGCKFLVAARATQSGKVNDINDLSVPADFKSIFVGLPNFRSDISSTYLRNRGLKGSR